MRRQVEVDKKAKAEDVDVDDAESITAVEQLRNAQAEVEKYKAGLHKLREAAKAQSDKQDVALKESEARRKVILTELESTTAAMADEKQRLQQSLQELHQEALEAA